jgi:hypothetical protein
MSYHASRRVWEQAPHAGGALLVLLALAQAANEDNICWPSIETLAARARLKERHVRDLLADLEDAGDIARLVGHGRGRYSVYAVLTGLTEAEREQAKQAMVVHAEQKGHQSAPIPEETGHQSAGISGEKGQYSAPNDEQKGHQSAPILQEKGRSSAQKRGAPAHNDNGLNGAYGRAKGAQNGRGNHHGNHDDDDQRITTITGSDQDHGGGGDGGGPPPETNLPRFLAEQGVSAGAITKIIALKPDPPTAITDFLARRADNWQIKHIVAHWYKHPPVKGRPYGRTEPPPARPVAPDHAGGSGGPAEPAALRTDFR